MIKIEENNKQLIIENYQTQLINLSWLDVVDNLEIHGVYIRIDKILNIPIATYKGKKYLVEDHHIDQLETSNIVEFVSC